MEASEEDIVRMGAALGGVSDPRRKWGALRHKLPDILAIGLCSIAAGGKGFNAMEDFGRAREGWLRGFLELPNGIPDADTFRRMFERVNPARLLECLQQWLSQSGEPGGREVNIDGKEARGCGVRMVSAWVNSRGLTLGQVAAGERSNEITAIPQLLDMIDVKGDTVTIDAMGCQTEIAAKIRARGAHYVLAVKGNQPSLCEGIREYFLHLDEGKAPRLPGDAWESGLEKDHGRIERRSVRTSRDVGFLGKKWKDLKTIVEFRGERSVRNGDAWETAVTERYYISDLDCPAEEFCRIIRGHWSVENNLHWMLDVNFGEDGCQARKDNSPQNLTVLRKIALGLLRAAEAGKRVGVARKMFIAGLDTAFLQRVIFGK